MIVNDFNENTRQISLIKALDRMEHKFYPTGSRYYGINTITSDFDYIMECPEMPAEDWTSQFDDLGFWFIDIPPSNKILRPVFHMRHALGIDILAVNNAFDCWKIQQLIKKHHIFKQTIDFTTKQNRDLFLEFCLELIERKMNNA